MDYDKIPDHPDKVSATTILSRLLDGLAFRYRWATEGLTDNELKFRPCESSMDMMELLEHIYRLAIVSDNVFNNRVIEKTTPLGDFTLLREKTIALYRKNSKELLEMDDSDLSECKFKPKNGSNEYPFWNLINGPIADALTHVGQITSWRRMAGNPIPKIDPFMGKRL